MVYEGVWIWERSSIAILSVNGKVGDDALYEAHRDFVNRSTCIKALAEKVCAGGVVPTFDRHPHRLEKLDQKVDDQKCEIQSEAPKPELRIVNG